MLNYYSPHHRLNKLKVLLSLSNLIGTTTVSFDDIVNNTNTTMLISNNYATTFNKIDSNIVKPTRGKGKVRTFIKTKSGLTYPKSK